MSEVADNKERFHFLDGLRGIASMMIVFHHAFTSNIVKWLYHIGLPAAGYFLAFFTQSGVELFFVLSGVVLLRPYLRKQKKFNTGNYLFRRIKRIYPPYLVALMFSVAVCWYINAYPTWYTAKVFHMTFYWPEILKELPIINTNGFYYNLAYWSLGIEVLFYLLVPFILLIFPFRDKISNLRMWVMIVLTIIVSVSLQLWLTARHPDIYSYKHVIPDIYQAICYPLCFLMGILLAAKDFTVRTASVFIISGMLFIAGSWWYMPAVNAGYGLFYAGIIILSFQPGSFRRLLSTPVMIWIGERSYSLFLVHFAVFYFTDAVAAHFTATGSVFYALFTRGVGVPLAFFAAMLLFHFVERWQARGLLTGNMFWPWQVGRLKGVIG